MLAFQILRPGVNLCDMIVDVNSLVKFRWTKIAFENRLQVFLIFSQSFLFFFGHEWRLTIIERFQTCFVTHHMQFEALSGLESFSTVRTFDLQCLQISFQRLFFSRGGSANVALEFLHRLLFLDMFFVYVLVQ